MDKLMKSSSQGSVQICSPGNIKGGRTRPTVAELTWDEPYSTCHLCPDALSFEISGEGIATVETARPPFELQGLNPSIDYRVCVRAKAAGNNISQPAYFNVLRWPGMPGNLRIIGRTDRDVTLAWEAPVGETQIYDYLVLHQGQPIATVRGLTYTMSYPLPVNPYEVEVHARDIRGNLSDPGVLHTLAPGKPTGLAADRISIKAAVLRWSHSSDNFAVTRYEVLEKDEVIDSVHRDTLFYAVTGLVPETSYLFSVRALDSTGNRSEASEPLTVTTPLLYPPTNIQILNVTRSSITLAWDRPEGGIGLVGYISEADNQQGSSRTIQSPALGVTFTGLRSSSTYSVNISSHDAFQRVSEPATLQITTTTADEIN